MAYNRRAVKPNNLNLIKTNELIEIWQNHNTSEWQEDVFDEIKEILQDRLGFIPPLLPEAQCDQILTVALEKINGGEYSSAQQDCINAIQIYNQSSDAHYFLGITHEELGNLVEAENNIKKAISLDSNQKDYWKCLKRIESRQRQDFENSLAKKHLDQASTFILADEDDKALIECKKAENNYQIKPMLTLCWE